MRTRPSTTWLVAAAASVLAVAGCRRETTSRATQTLSAPADSAESAGRIVDRSPFVDAANPLGWATIAERRLAEGFSDAEQRAVVTPAAIGGGPEPDER